ncbi:hypothetical protein M3685_13310 [Heyndrickxia oleronia]|uniref:hypothetical protein n=1 Tax=Heyndrickxia TaxID=2837504 RepID=UPI001B17ED8D|nr:hypothetical protein [Heyndrickxia oleronia]MCM3240699.1 hypothetical protein [Heyndrickxia oleronia]MCM3454900.1 hypothetical protein [Heyndrickxia oleronia]GIN41389.1 hypothetical protein J19TS1_43380 [Heyndrickxia oleronia]
MPDIKTYPKMNEEIKILLSMSSDPFKQYTLQRIIELEEEVESLKGTIEIIERTWSPIEI